MNISDASNAGKESIHSGQFMVSHFESEDAQDDLDDSEVVVPEIPHLSKVEDSSVCMEVQLYDPMKSVELNEGSITTGNAITSHLEIETSLTKLFKCMNLAYSQKLTSPKWNHFKGVRLRWKDKIRLNNVIWRCWHMQFILKKRTPVCQFASPLDADTHINPQSVVLEGKYWKRQMTVIKAEYRKWRKNSKSKNSGCLVNDSKSEFDFLDWSPINERNLMLSDDWTSDTLFSSINGPFPFPDPREIARGAGIAEFIQPSLGPLQPNLDDIDLTLAGSDEINPNHLLDVEINNVNELQINSNVHTNMIELNNPLNTLQYSDMNQQYASREVLDVGFGEANANLESISCEADTRAINNEMENRINQSPAKYFITPHDNLFTRQIMNECSGKSVIKGRISKNMQRPFRREPHNYDKAQPTPHQTTIYQQMLAEQHQENIQSNSVPSTQHQDTTQQQKLELRMQYTSEQFKNSSLSRNTSSNSLDGELNNSTGNYFNISIKNSNIKHFGYSGDHTVIKNFKVEPTIKPSNDIFGSLKKQPPEVIASFKPYFNTQRETIKKSSSTGTYLNIKATDGNYSHMQSNSQKLSQPIHDYTHSLPLSLSSSHEVIQQSHPTKLSQQYFPQIPQSEVILPKEMFRSNSLPLSVSLHKIDNFATPKSIDRSGKSRSRSNSIHQHMSAAADKMSNDLNSPQNLESATSNSMLNSTLALLLKSQTNTIVTPVSSTKLITKYSDATNSIPEHILHPDSGATHNVFMSQSVPSTTSHSSLRTSTQQKTMSERSPKKSASLPVPVKPNILQSTSGQKILSYPPPFGSLSSSSQLCISPEMFHEFDPPLSPVNNIKYPREKQRRVGHIHAEQKRRYNIKNGFDMLYSLIPQLQQNACAKLSKAAMLQKGAEYIKQLRSERNTLKEKIDILCIERDSLNNSLMHLHSVLPANGAPLTRQGTDHVRQLYEQYVRIRTLNNWKFWILGLILEPLLASYISSVSSISMDEMRRTVFLWIDQHCSLIDLRPAVSNKLKYLSMKTDILSDPPSTLQEEIEKIIHNSSRQHPSLSGL